MKQNLLLIFAIAVVSCNNQNNNSQNTNVQSEQDPHIDQQSGANSIDFSTLMGTYKHTWQEDFIRPDFEVPLRGESSITLQNNHGNNFSFCIFVFESKHACEETVTGSGKFISDSRAQIDFISYEDTIHAEIEIANTKLVFHELYYSPCPAGFINDTLSKVNTMPCVEVENPLDL